MHDKTIKKDTNVHILNNNGKSNINIVKNRLKERENENLHIIKDNHFIESNSRSCREGSPIIFNTQKISKNRTKLNQSNINIINNKKDIASSSLTKIIKKDDDNTNIIYYDKEKKESFDDEAKKIQLDHDNTNIEKPKIKYKNKEPVHENIIHPIQNQIQDNINDEIQDNLFDEIKNNRSDEDNTFDDTTQNNASYDNIFNDTQDNISDDIQNNIQNNTYDNIKDNIHNNIYNNIKNNIQENIQDEHNDIHFGLQDHLHDNINNYIDNNNYLDDIASTSSATINNNITVTLPVPITNDIFIDRSNLNFNYTLNENIYNFSEGLVRTEEKELTEYYIDHESIAITLAKMSKLLDEYTNTKKFLRAWEYWFYRWSNCRWYTQRQDHWLSKQKKAKQKLLQMIEENFRNVDGFLKNNNSFDTNNNYENVQQSSSSSSKYLHRMKSTRKIWIHQQQQMKRGNKTEIYSSRLGKKNSSSNQSKKINKLISKPPSSSSIKKDKTKVSQNSLSLKYNQEFKYYHHYIPETLKHLTALKLAVKYINVWLKLQEKIDIPNEDKKEEKIQNKMDSRFDPSTSTLSATISTNQLMNSNKKRTNKNKETVTCSAFALLTTLMNRLQLNNSNDKTSSSRDDSKYKEARKKKISELNLFDLKIENNLGYDVKRYLRGICIIELLLIKVNCFDDKLFVHTINFFRQYIDLSFLIPFMIAYIINSPNISSWCVGMAWEFFHSINELKLFWSIIHRKKNNKSWSGMRYISFF